MMAWSCSLWSLLQAVLLLIFKSFQDAFQKSSSHNQNSWNSSSQSRFEKTEQLGKKPALIDGSSGDAISYAELGIKESGYIRSFQERIQALVRYWVYSVLTVQNMGSFFMEDFGRRNQHHGQSVIYGWRTRNNSMTARLVFSSATPTVWKLYPKSQRINFFGGDFCYWWWKDGTNSYEVLFRRWK